MDASSSSVAATITTVEAATATAAVAVTVRIAADCGKGKKPRRQNNFFCTTIISNLIHYHKPLKLHVSSVPSNKDNGPTPVL